MEKDLIYIIADYLTDEISEKVQGRVSFNWSYDFNKNHFIIKFELANTNFTVIAKVKNTKNFGMTIEPDEHRIKITCHNYLTNFEQVVNIIGEFEKELKFFDETLPSSARRQYIRENYSLVKPEDSLKRPILNILSCKYLDDNHLEDEYGAKEITLDHLFGKEFYINMKKKV